ncbi:hypothetical protein [Lactococcus garvieae]
MNEMKMDNLQFIIAQILLIDPTSEKPRVHPRRKSIKKVQLIKRLEKLVQGYEESQIDIELDDYYLAIESLKKKKKKDYEELLDEIVLAYSSHSKLKKSKSKNEVSRIPINMVVPSEKIK